MNIVLDTNVLVSGLLSPFSPCGELVRMVSASALRLCLDARILTEYAEVLKRPRFNFDGELVADLLNHIEHAGLLVSGVPLPFSLPDPDDEPFLEVALAGHAVCLITGNIRHFPSSLRSGITVLLPGDFLRFYRN